MSSSDDSLESDVNILQTRASQYLQQPLSSPTAAEASKTKKIPKKKSGRQNAIKCRQHEDNNKNTWTSINSDCRHCTRFTMVDELKECVLPRTVDVLNLLITLKDNNKGCASWYVDAFYECAQLISMRWLGCNVYPSPLFKIKRHLDELFIKEYCAIKKYSSKSESYWNQCSPFLGKITNLFDIQTEKTLQTSWFKKTGVTHDSDFYDKQVLNPPKGYSTAKVDKMWEKTAKRREKTKKHLTQPTQNTNNKSTDTHTQMKKMKMMNKK